MKARLCAIPLVAAALLIAACGRSSSTSSTTTPAATPNKLAARTAVRSRHDAISRGVVTHRPLHGTGGSEINDDNPGGADTGLGHPADVRNPCTLVSKAEAQAIIDGPIASPREAPLGPTCIYQPLRTKSSVTLAVESIDFAKVMPQIRKRVRSAIAGHTAYCGDYGRPTTFVPLTGGRVLNVTAPCAVGTRFAEQALPRLQSYG